MKRTPRARRVEPAIGATATHLSIDNYATGPRAVTLVTVLTRLRRFLAGNVREQSLNVAPPRQVQHLFRTALLGKAHARLAGQSLRQCAFDGNVLVAGLLGKVLGGMDTAVVAFQMRSIQVMLLNRILDRASENASRRQVKLLLVVVLGSGGGSDSSIRVECCMLIMVVIMAMVMVVVVVIVIVSLVSGNNVLLEFIREGVGWANASSRSTAGRNGRFGDLIGPATAGLMNDAFHDGPG